jgi:hypothetical protein
MPIRNVDCGIQDKLPQVLRIKRAGIFSQLLEQITNGDAVAG